MIAKKKDFELETEIWWWDW